jgi:formate hydrogenlyase regulatory protein HycA
MSIPKKIKIKRIEDFYTKCIGKHSEGQFMAFITATLPTPIPKDWERHKRWYTVLHTFNNVGRHIKTEAWFAGTSADGEEIVGKKARTKRDEMVATLKDVVFNDVEVELFSTVIDGFTFGLLNASKPDENYESIHLLPNDFAFFAPWNGEFET